MPSTTAPHQAPDQPASARSPWQNTALVRVGLMGQVGRFQTDLYRPCRAERVVCRTARGIEVGVTLALANCNDMGEPPAANGTAVASPATDGRILRRMTAEDELLWGQLRHLSEDAFAKCVAQLAASGCDAVLLDVEPLLDGKTLYFHFLSAVEPQFQTELDKLVAVYERQVRHSKFAQLVEHGCGPGCGTSQAKNACATKSAAGGGCAICKVAATCGQSS